MTVVMKADIEKLKDETGRRQELRFKPRLEPLEIGHDVVRFPEPAEIQVKLTNLEEVILAEVKGQVPARLACTRCAVLYDYTFELDFAVEYREGQPEPGERDLYEFYQGNVVDLEPALRKELILSLPINHLCRPDCQGICPVCGQNWNEGSCDCSTETVDPRLAILGELEFDEDE